MIPASGTPPRRVSSIPTASDVDDYVEMFGVNPMEVHCR